MGNMVRDFPSKVMQCGEEAAMGAGGRIPIPHKARKPRKGTRLRHFSKQAAQQRNIVDDTQEPGGREPTKSH